MITYGAQGAETGRYWYHFDALGSVVALSQYNTTDGYASIVERYAYSAFGETTVTLDGGTGNPYRFTARRQDPETALYYYRARIYSPALGRFLQPDPIGYGDGMNMYAYVGNKPLGYVDPMGLCKDRSFGRKAWEGDFVGTQYGNQALDYYANRIAFGNGNWAQKAGWYTGAFFSALWTPENWKTTAVTIGTAGYSAIQARVATKAAQSGVQSIETLYGIETQSMSAEAQAALSEANSGGALFRTGQLGKSMTAESQYWSLQNPLTPGYAGQIGLPGVTPDFIMGGTLNSGASVITNAARALGSNAGGAIQVVTSEGGVGIQFFVMP